jgi:hypothetical protein
LLADKIIDTELVLVEVTVMFTDGVALRADDDVLETDQVDDEVCDWVWLVVALWDRLRLRGSLKLGEGNVALAVLGDDALAVVVADMCTVCVLTDKDPVSLDSDRSCVVVGVGGLVLLMVMDRDGLSALAEISVELLLLWEGGLHVNVKDALTASLLLSELIRLNEALLLSEKLLDKSSSVGEELIDTPSVNDKERVKLSWHEVLDEAETPSLVAVAETDWSSLDSELEGVYDLSCVVISLVYVAGLESEDVWVLVTSTLVLSVMVVLFGSVPVRVDDNAAVPSTAVMRINKRLDAATPDILSYLHLLL